MRGDAPRAWSGVADQVWIINLHSKVAAQIYQSVSVNHGMGHVQPACKDCMGAKHWSKGCGRRGTAPATHVF
jgi:hypothetical protein